MIYTTEPDLILPETEQHNEVHVWLNPPHLIIYGGKTFYTFQNTYLGLTMIEFIEKTTNPDNYRAITPKALKRIQVASNFLLERFILG